MRKYKDSRNRKMLNNLEAPCLKKLVKLIREQDKATLICWTASYCKGTMLPIWNRYYPEDRRPEEALNTACDWLKGKIKLPEAKKVILECHKAARMAEKYPAAQAAARAIGQSASTIHSARHSLGLALYGTVALAYDSLGDDVVFEEIEKFAALECEKMFEELKKLAEKG